MNDRGLIYLALVLLCDVNFWLAEERSDTDPLAWATAAPCFVGGLLFGYLFLREAWKAWRA